MKNWNCFILNALIMLWIRFRSRFHFHLLTFLPILFLLLRSIMRQTSRKRWSRFNLDIFFPVAPCRQWNKKKRKGGSDHLGVLWHLLEWKRSKCAFLGLKASCVNKVFFFYFILVIKKELSKCFEHFFWMTDINRPHFLYRFCHFSVFASFCFVTNLCWNVSDW